MAALFVRHTSSVEGEYLGCRALNVLFKKPGERKSREIKVLLKHTVAVDASLFIRREYLSFLVSRARLIGPYLCFGDYGITSLSKRCI